MEAGFDWGSLTATAQSMSLFARRRLLDLRLPAGKPGDAGSQAIVQICESGSEDTALMIVCGRLEARTRQVKWFKAVERAGLVIEHKQVPAAQLPAWVSARAKARGLDLDSDAVTLLAHYVEGNLLAAAQEIDKLILLRRGEGTVGYDEVSTSITENARFSIFVLTDHCMAGNTRQALRCLRGLRQEGVEPVLITWALAKQVRTLYRVAAGLEAGQQQAQLFKSLRVWYKQVPLTTAALARHRNDDWARLLGQMAHLDRVVKGRAEGDAWHALEQACLLFCGGGDRGMGFQVYGTG